MTKEGNGRDMTDPVYIGLISGTSRDGLDAALVAIDKDHRPHVILADCAPYPPALRNAIDELIALGRCPSEAEVQLADAEFGHFLTDVCRSLMKKADMPDITLTAIGSHGQTVWHDPGAEPGISLQIGNADLLSSALEVPVVFNFREADLQAGGVGAPLAPLLHHALFADKVPCAVINLGGIANITLLDQQGDVRGFDTGPANCLLDFWTQKHRHAPYDANGDFSRTGAVLPTLLESMLSEPYFSQAAPKSTGIELFNEHWLEQHLAGDEPARDVQRTLLELTVETIARALEQAPESPKQAWLCGGGVHNGYLVERLRGRLEDVSIKSSVEAGINPDWVEATLFAWLAHRRMHEQPSKTGPITGASKPVLLGDIAMAATDS